MSASDRPGMLRALWAPMAYMAVIWLLSSLQGSRAGGGSHWTLEWPALQNALHVPLFGLLAWLWLRALARLDVGRVASAIAAATMSLAWALVDEWHQSFVPGRYASLSDVVLDAIGIAGAIAAFGLVSRRGREATSPST